MSEEKENLMIWKHPMRIFANADYLSENNKKFALWFSYCSDDDFDIIGEEQIKRVIWAIKEDDGCYSMRRFFTSDYTMILNDESLINANYFFYSDKDFFREKLLELKKIHSFSVKYSGKKGEQKQAYICPRKPEKFGIKMWGENGCYYCRYCYMVAQNKSTNEKMYASYCCYPTQVRELCETHPGYECPKADIYNI